MLKRIVIGSKHAILPQGTIKTQDLQSTSKFDTDLFYT